MSVSVRFILAAVLLIACGSHRSAAPPFVFDSEEVLDAGQERALDALLREHERRTGNEIAVVTHPTFHGRSARDFAVIFGDSLGVGKKGLDNGVVIAFSRSRRAVFIATGRGTEKVLADSTCQRIVDEAMLPRFKEARYFDGLRHGVEAVVRHLDDASR